MRATQSILDSLSQPHTKVSFKSTRNLENQYNYKFIDEKLMSRKIQFSKRWNELRTIILWPNVTVEQNKFFMIIFKISEWHSTKFIFKIINEHASFMKTE